MKWLLALFLIPSVAFAEEISIPDVSGGMNTHDPSFRVQPGFSPYMRNVTVDDGRLQGIKGYETLGTTNTLTKVTGIFPYRKDSGITTFLVTDSSKTLETSDFVTYTFVSSGSNTGALLQWLQVREKMWGFNGIDNVITWDGTTWKKLNGLGGLPDVPKFKVAAYYQERVFGFNNPSGASDLDWSDVASTDGVRLEPDDPRAWPATNNLKIGEGDGQLGTALWIQDGQLRIGKERSIYTLYGKNSSDYQARREENLGDGVASNESVVQQDGHTYWLGQYGIYEDGVRISDLIEPDVEMISRNSISSIRNIWDLQSDFEKGDFYGTTTTSVGQLTISTIPLTVTGTRYGAIPGYITLTAGNTYYGPAKFSFSNSVSSSDLKFTKSISINANSGSGNPVVKAIIFNPYTGESHSAIATCSGSPFTFTFSSQAPLFDGNQLNSSSYTITFEDTNPSPATCQLFFSGELNVTFMNSTTVQYISDVASNTSVTTWGNLDSSRQENQGTIDFFYRASTSVVNITTQTWKSISPGTIPNEPTQNTFIQWATTITQIPVDLAPSIDYVTIDHTEGVGATNRAFGISWKNRYWLATSTTNSNTDSLIFVKSKITNKIPNAWMPIEGIGIRALSKNADVLYGGSSSTGAVYRLDYGTSFDGSAIRMVYDYPDMTLGENYRTKNIKNYKIDVQKVSGMTLNLGTSINQGDFSYKSISLDGSGRMRQIVKGVTNPAKTLRVRILNNQLDKTLDFYDLSVEYMTTDIIE